MVDVDERVSQTVDEVNELAGKYLTFKLSKEEYGLEILRVREIIGVMDITSVPRTPPSVRGVINLRGKVIPVVDLRVKFGMEHIEDSDQTCIIVVEVMKGDRSVEMGILVDAVSEVLDITGEDIEEAPSFGNAVDTEFILGMAKANNRVTILLNIQNVVTAGELKSAGGTPQKTDQNKNKESTEKAEEEAKEESGEKEVEAKEKDAEAETENEEEEDNKEKHKECVESVT